VRRHSRRVTPVRLGYLVDGRIGGFGPGVPQGVGLLVESRWQDSLLWWSFDPSVDVERFVEDNLKRFVAVIVSAGPAGS
jgi:hypothetical protein